MEFKAGDRVHVIKLNKSRVDFYATLKGGNDGNPFILSDCSDGRFECSSVFKPNTGEVGLNKWDYYVLVEDEEDIGGNNMPTIKRKVEMNLPQLIEWGFENDVTNTWYRASNVEEYISEVFFDATGLPQFSNTVNKNDTFTVEVEEEITEDTKIHKMIELSDKGLLGGTGLYINSTVNQAKTNESLAFYIVNDDLTMTLIWKNGRLVE